LSKRLILLFFLLITVPYLVAYLAAGPDYVFSGFLFNPLDGNSYLAKMVQGGRMELLFRLPYTAEPGKGAYILSFYLILGALARILHIPQIFVFHLARLFGASILIFHLDRFVKATIPNRDRYTFVSTLLLLGLGMGWLIFFTEKITSDFWVAEAYPFLSAYSSPHFTISMAILIWLLIPVFRDHTEQKTPGRRWSYAIFTIFISAFLSGMSPFAFVLALGILGLLYIWECVLAFFDPSAVLEKKNRWRSALFGIQPRSILWQIALVFLGGTPVAVYTFLIIHSDPVLALWNAQNITPTPPAWDLLLAFSPALILAIPGVYQAIKEGNRAGRLLIVWVLIGIVTILLPFGLQRRFLFGASIPLSLLAAYGLDFIEITLGTRAKTISLAATALALPTTFLVILVGQFGVLKHEPLFFLTRGEVNAFDWISAHSNDNDLILADPRIGLFIPSWTGRRVIYGHPFETVNAENDKAQVIRFFQHVSSDPENCWSFLKDRAVDWVFYSPDEQALGEFRDTLGLLEVYNQTGIRIYRVKLE